MVSDVSPSTVCLLRKTWGHLSPRRRLQFAFLFTAMLASGVAELVSLGAVLPFLAALSNPENLWEHFWIQWLAARFGYTESHQLVIPVTLAFACAAVVAAGIDF